MQNTSVRQREGTRIDIDWNPANPATGGNVLVAGNTSSSIASRNSTLPRRQHGVAEEDLGPICCMIAVVVSICLISLGGLLYMTGALDKLDTHVVFKGLANDIINQY